MQHESYGHRSEFTLRASTQRKIKYSVEFDASERSGVVSLKRFEIAQIQSQLRALLGRADVPHTGEWVQDKFTGR